MQKNRSQARKSQGGFTITELMLVVVVAAAIIGGAFIGYKTVSASNTDQQNMIGTANLLASVKSKWQGIGSYAAVTDANIIAANLVTKPITTSGGAIYNSYDRAIAFSGQGRDFAAAITVPTDKCIESVGALDGIAYRMDVSTAAIPIATAENIATVTIKPSGGVLNPTLTATQCGGATTVITAWVK